MKTPRLETLSEKWSADPDARGFREDLESLVLDLETELDHARASIGLSKAALRHARLFIFSRKGYLWSEQEERAFLQKRIDAAIGGEAVQDESFQQTIDACSRQLIQSREPWLFKQSPIKPQK